MTVNADFLYRVQIVAPFEDDEPAKNDRITVENATAFIERLVNDLRAAGACTKAEALDNTIADNLALFDAVCRGEARRNLAALSALSGAISAAFSEEAGRNVQKQAERLSAAAGYTPPGRSADPTALTL